MVGVFGVVVFVMKGLVGFEEVNNEFVNYNGLSVFVFE